MHRRRPEKLIPFWSRAVESAHLYLYKPTTSPNKMPTSPELIRYIYDVINDYFQETWDELEGCDIKLTNLYKLIREICENYPDDEHEDKLIKEVENKTDKNLLTIIKTWITKFNNLRKKWNIKASIKDNRLDFTGMNLPYKMP